MKKVKISLDDLLVVLEAMRDSAGTQDVIFFEYKGMPALCDADDQDNIVTFAAVDENGDLTNEEPDEGLH